MPDEMELRAWRAEVALAKGVPAGHAKRLVGNTLAEMQADADQLLADLGPAGQQGGQAGGAVGQQQAPNFDQGQQGGTPAMTTGSAGHEEAVRRFGAQAVEQRTTTTGSTAERLAAPREVYGRG